VDEQDVGRANNADDRRDIANKIEIEVHVERRVNCCCGVTPQQRIAIGWCSHDCFRCDIARGAWPVIDYELLAKPFRNPLPHETHKDVDAASGRVSDNAAHRSGWVVL
jgi:hypothetical protein